MSVSTSVAILNLVQMKAKNLMAVATFVAMPNLVRMKAKNLTSVAMLQRTRMKPLQLLGLAKMLRGVQSQWKNLVPVTISVTMLRWLQLHATISSQLLSNAKKSQKL